MRRILSAFPMITGLFVLFLSLAGTTLAADDLGPAIGSQAPDIGTLLNQSSQPRKFADLVGEKGLVLIFFRSVGWCPYCQLQIVEFNGGRAEIEKRGFNVAALSYDSPETMTAFAQRRQITLTMLSDPNSDVIDRYNLRDPQYKPGTKPYGVPRPIIFVLDRSGVIKAKLYEEGYVNRPAVGVVTAKLDELSAAQR